MASDVSSHNQEAVPQSQTIELDKRHLRSGEMPSDKPILNEEAGPSSQPTSKELKQQMVDLLDYMKVAPPQEMPKLKAKRLDLILKIKHAMRCEDWKKNSMKICMTESPSHQRTLDIAFFSFSNLVFG